MILSKAFADSFHGEPAGNILAFNNHSSCVDTLKGYEEHYLLAGRVDTEG